MDFNERGWGEVFSVSIFFFFFFFVVVVALLYIARSFVFEALFAFFCFSVATRTETLKNIVFQSHFKRNRERQTHTNTRAQKTRPSATTTTTTTTTTTSFFFVTEKKKE
jgi:hypothetical protein